MNDAPIPNIVSPTAVGTSAWAILRGSLDHQASRTAAFDHLFHLGWRPAYVLFRTAFNADWSEARNLTQSLFLQVASVAAREARPQRYRVFLKEAARDHVLERRGLPVTGLIPPMWVSEIHTGIEEVEARLEGDTAEESPDHLFDREFALVILTEALSQFESEAYALGNESWPDLIRLRFLEAESASLDEVARGLALRSDEAVRVLYKARQALRRQLVGVIRSTLPPCEHHSTTAVDEEILRLTRALASELDR